MFSNNEAAQGCIHFVSIEMLTSEYNAANFTISEHPDEQDVVVFETALPNLEKFQLSYDWVPCSKITTSLPNASDFTQYALDERS